MRAICVTAMVFFLKVLFRRLLDHSYVKVSSQQLRGTLKAAFWRTPYGWRFYRSRWWNENQRRCLENYHSWKKCTKIDDVSLVVIRFFFSQTNLVFKCNPVFIRILDSFRHSLFALLPFDFCLYSTDFEVYPMPLRLFYKNE